LPTNPRITLEMVVAEVALRSREEISEVVILQHYPFLVDQLAVLATPEDWGPQLHIPSSLFVAQLQKEGHEFLQKGGIWGLLSSSSGNKKRKALAQRYYEAYQLIAALAGIPAEDPTEKKKKKSKKVKDAAAMSSSGVPVAEGEGAVAGDGTIGGGAEGADGDLDKVAKKPKRIRYPLEDTLLWELEAEKGTFIWPRPVPAPQDQLKCPDALVPSVLSIWTTLINCRSILKLPILPLDALIDCLFDEKTMHHILVDIHVELVAMVLRSNEHMPTKVIANEDDGLRGGMDLDDYDDEKDQQVDQAKKPIINRLVLPNDSLLQSEEDLKAFLTTGDAWIEVLRLLVAQENKLQVPSYLDPLGEVESIIFSMMGQPEAMPFCRPVDPKLDGVPTYLTVISEPMDLGTILTRIHSGWYDVKPQLEESHSATDEETDGPPNYEVGQLVDAYSTKLGRWYAAKVLAVDAEGRTVQLRFVDSLYQKDEVLSFDSDRIRAWKSVSIYEVRPLLRIVNDLFAARCATIMWC
jgi:Bromodomain